MLLASRFPAIAWTAALAIMTVASASFAAEPVDLFANSPPLAPGFARVGSWNVQHLELKPNAGEFLAGANDEEDHAIVISSFAQAIRDLKLDVVALVEVQPRPNEPDHLKQLVEDLNRDANSAWRSTRTEIEYDDPTDPHGNLQFGLLWNEARGVTIDVPQAKLLDKLRQPRGGAGTLLNREQRAPWLVPVTFAGPNGAKLEFDLLVVHFKSGGATPQNAEVDAVAQFIRQHQQSGRHLLMCGDWNIRPDEDNQGRGRPRLRKLTVPVGRSSLMRLLTVGDLPPSLDDWERIDVGVGGVNRFAPLSGVLPFSHFNFGDPGFHTLLDHMAISRSMEEHFEHPVRVTLANGEVDAVPGIEIPRPILQPIDFAHFTDHLPVVVTFAIRSQAATPPSLPAVRIFAVRPNPIGDDAQDEAITIKNISQRGVDLRGWMVRDLSGAGWSLDAVDLQPLSEGTLPRAKSLVLKRRGRAMALHNGGGTLILCDAAGKPIDSQAFGEARAGEIIEFP